MANVFVCGDIVNYGHSDGIILSEDLATIVKGSDYSICNFEAPVEGAGKPVPKSGGHHYQRVGTVKGLKEQGFDLLCLANNHMMDYGEEGLYVTINEAENVGIETIGAGMNVTEAYRPVIKQFQDVTVGFINACEAQFGVLNYATTQDQAGYAWINHAEIDKQILELKAKCDVVVVLAHAGLEHYSIPQKEWRQRYKHFCHLGVDVVIGSHPHVPQGYERYADSVIFYSLGNFYFDSVNFKDKEDQTYSVLLKIEKNEPVEFELVYSHKKDGLVQLSNESNRININELNELLENEYEKLHEDMSLHVYNQIIKRNFIYSLGSTAYDGGVVTTLKRIINILLGRQKKVDKALLSLHLVRNETYHYAMVNALEAIANKK
ncbi:CapA family protein [Ornithinibacillus sp. 179-J 7C1 HS]|uniref:CapA family protein n=1 Tax=Ornithinibacillus sp. 179-J 7C1 HS TaxID=3142384 RepID=UPI0039A0518A